MVKLQEIQGVIAENIRALRLRFRPAGQTAVNKFSKYCGIGNGAVQALESGIGDPQLSTLVKIASKFGMEPWQLLIKGATPDTKPKIVTPKEMAFYLALEAAREATRREEESQQPSATSGSRRIAYRRRRKE